MKRLGRHRRNVRRGRGGDRDIAPTARASDSIAQLPTCRKILRKILLDEEDVRLAARPARRFERRLAVIERQKPDARSDTRERGRFDKIIATRAKK